MTWQLIRTWSLGVLLCACQRQTVPTSEQAPAVAAPDRLTKEESPPGVERVLGMELPRDLRRVSDFGNRVSLAGPMPLAAVVTFLSQHVESTPVEYSGERAVFARVRLKGDSSGKQYRMEVTRRQRTTRVQISDVTLPPVTQGLDESARWEQAGRRPDGTPIDTRKMY